MSNETAHSVATVLAELASMMKAGWSCPSPEVGFARHVFLKTGEVVPVPDDGGRWADGERLDLAPALATAGYLLASGQNPPPPEAMDAWAEGLDRLSAREPFTSDRLSFAYRPLEVLGIALGAANCRLITAEVLTWLRNVVERLRQEVVVDAWSDLLHETAADALGVRWRDRLFLQLDGANVEVLALLRWIVSTRHDASFVTATDRGRLDGELLRRCLLNPIRRSDVARAAVLHHALRCAAHDHPPLALREATTLASTGGPGTASGRPERAFDPSLLQQLAAGTTVQIQFIQVQGGQHVGDKINIGGDNIGGAVGRSASVVARDIAAYKNMVESATHIEPELRLKLQQAREEVEKADLSDFDKQDVAESLKRLTAELDKPERDPGVITRFWNRVQEVAPTIASILSSVASITKIVTGG